MIKTKYKTRLRKELWPIAKSEKSKTTDTKYKLIRKITSHQTTQGKVNTKLT